MEVYEEGDQERGNHDTRGASRTPYRRLTTTDETLRACKQMLKGGELINGRWCWELWWSGNLIER